MLSVVVDLGGTNIRLAVCEPRTGELTQLEIFLCADFSSIDEALIQYFEGLEYGVDHLCIGIASAFDGDYVAMLNLNWAFSIRALKKKLHLTSLYVINDYTAISLALPFLSSSEKVQIGSGEAQQNGVTAVLGPGTGLGVSHIVKFAEQWISLDGEGGHVSFSANTQEQAELLTSLQAKFGHVSVERVLSGQGLVNIYQSLSRRAGLEIKFTLPKDISRAGLDGTCCIARKSLDIFCQVLGGFAGNIALNLNCTGGVYIAGGIVPRFIPFLEQSEFRHFFEEKGRVKGILNKIPTFVITKDNPGLLGASVYLRQQLSK